MRDGAPGELKTIKIMEKTGDCAVDVCGTYEVRIYCGLRVGYDGEVQSIDRARYICSKFADDEMTCVTLTPTEYIYVKGREPGVIVGMINYPRFPKLKYEIVDLAYRLAKELMKGLMQYRVTAVFPDRTVMFTNPDLVEPAQDK